MKNNLNGWYRPRKGLIGFLLLLVAILTFPIFVSMALRVIEELEEKEREVEKRRADLVNRFT